MVRVRNNKIKTLFINIHRRVYGHGIAQIRSKIYEIK